MNTVKLFVFLICFGLMVNARTITSMGSYSITSAEGQLTILGEIDNVYVTCSGAGSIAGGTYGVYMGGSNTNVQIKDCPITASAGTGSGAIGIYAYHATNLEIINCDITANGGNGNNGANGADGIDAGDSSHGICAQDGSSGQVGGSATGIYGTFSNLTITSTNVDANGGDGGDGGDGGQGPNSWGPYGCFTGSSGCASQGCTFDTFCYGGNGANGGNGGGAVSLQILSSSTDITIDDTNSFSTDHGRPGRAGEGGDGGSGSYSGGWCGAGTVICDGNGGAGGDGGDAPTNYGFYANSAVNFTDTDLTIFDITNSQVGGNGDSGGSAGIPGVGTCGGHCSASSAGSTGSVGVTGSTTHRHLQSGSSNLFNTDYEIFTGSGTIDQWWRLKVESQKQTGESIYGVKLEHYENSTKVETSYSNFTSEKWFWARSLRVFGGSDTWVHNITGNFDGAYNNSPSNITLTTDTDYVLQMPYVGSCSEQHYFTNNDEEETNNYWFSNQNNTVYFKFNKTSLVSYGQLNLTGQESDSVSHNYSGLSDGSNYRQAWNGYGAWPAARSESFDSGNYTASSSDDDSYANFTYSNSRIWQAFEHCFNNTHITNLSISYRGYGKDEADSTPINEVTFKIWNVTDNSWYDVSTWTAITEQSVYYSITTQTSINDFLNDSNCIKSAVYAYDTNHAPPKPLIGTELIEVFIQSYPENVTAYIDDEHFYTNTSVLNATSGTANASDMKTALTNYLATCTADTDGTCEVPLKISSYQGELLLNGLVVKTCGQLCVSLTGDFSQTSYGVGQSAQLDLTAELANGTTPENSLVNITWYYPDGTVFQSWVNEETNEDGEVSVSQAITLSEPQGTYNSESFIMYNATCNATYNNSFTVTETPIFEVVPSSTDILISIPNSINKTFTISNTGNLENDISITAGNMSGNITVFYSPTIVSVGSTNTTKIQVNSSGMGEQNYTAVIYFNQSGATNTTVFINIEASILPVPFLELNETLVETSLDTTDWSSSNITLNNTGTDTSYWTNCSITGDLTETELNVTPQTLGDIGDGTGQYLNLTWDLTSATTGVQTNTLTCRGNNSNEASTVIETTINGPLLSTTPSTLASTVTAGGGASEDFSLENLGNEQADDIECVATGADASWITNIEPTTIGDLSVGSGTTIYLTMVSPAEASVGTHVIPIICNSTNGAEAILTYSVTIGGGGDTGDGSSGGGSTTEETTVIYTDLIQVNPSTISIKGEKTINELQATNGGCTFTPYTIKNLLPESSVTITLGFKDDSFVTSGGDEYVFGNIFSFKDEKNKLYGEKIVIAPQRTIKLNICVNSDKPFVGHVKGDVKVKASFGEVTDVKLIPFSLSQNIVAGGFDIISLLVIVILVGGVIYFFATQSKKMGLK